MREGDGPRVKAERRRFKRRGGKARPATALRRPVWYAVVALFAFALGTNALIIAQGALEPVRVVSGDSMLPAIHPGDGVVLASAEPEDLIVGEVVVFPDPEDPGRNVVHRIVGKQERGGSTLLLTKGDNNPELDPLPVLAQRVEGKVALRLPSFGLFLDFVRTPSGFSACVLCPILLFLLCCFAEKSSSRAEERRMAGSASFVSATG